MIIVHHHPAHAVHHAHSAVFHAFHHAAPHTPAGPTHATAHLRIRVQGQGGNKDEAKEYTDQDLSHTHPSFFVLPPMWSYISRDKKQIQSRSSGLFFYFAHCERFMRLSRHPENARWRYHQ
jgi:hypothetical protein